MTMPRQAFLCVSLLLLLLLALSTTVRAEHITVDSSHRFTGQKYTNLTVDVTAIKDAKHNDVEVVFDGCAFADRYAEISGFPTDPDDVTQWLDLRLSYTVLDDVTLTIKLFMPHESKIEIYDTYAKMLTGHPVFDLAFFDIVNGVTVTILSTVARWTGSQRGWVVSMQSGAALNNIRINSALFIVNTTAINALGIFSTDSIFRMEIDSNSVLAIDYASCDDCSTGLVSLRSPTKLQGGSMLRVSNSNTSKAPLVDFGSEIDVSTGSLLLISDNIATAGNLFSVGPLGVIQTTSNSAVTFRHLQVRDAGFSVPSFIPLADSSSVVYGDSCVVDNVPLQSVEDYIMHRLFITTFVTLDGRMSPGGVCAPSTCIPATSSPATGFAEGCQCECQDKYSLPDCTAMYDPITDYERQMGIPTTPPNSKDATSFRTVPMTVLILLLTLLTAGLACA